MRLGIVGHGADKFTEETQALAKMAILEAIIEHDPDVIVSGHSPMGGVDIWAEEAAELTLREKLIFPPEIDQWEPAQGRGYKARNLDIAQFSDLVLVIVVKDYPPGYEGMTFDGCYHCKGRKPEHVKSGACWTAWKSKGRAWKIIVPG